jgi:hypothetical protein
MQAQYFGYIWGGVCGVVGGVVGFVYGGPAGASVGWSVGYSVGNIWGTFMGQTFFPDKPHIYFPPPIRPMENRVQTSTWGTAIPLQFGCGRMAGNVIYMSDIVETPLTENHRQDGVRYYIKTLLYTCTIAVAFCEPVESIARIWLNRKVFADYRNPLSPLYPAGDNELAFVNWETSIARSEIYFSIHFGSESQAHDASLAAILGAADTPAYRGVTYIVFRDFPIGEFQGLPTVEIDTQPYIPGNLLTFNSATSMLYLHSGIGNTITVSTSFAAYTPLLEHNALTSESNLVKMNSTSKTVYIFDGITTSLLTSFSVSASVPYAPTGFSFDPITGYLIIGADNGLGGYSRRTVHYVFDSNGVFISSWQDDSVYGGTPIYAHLPDGRMIVQYYSSNRPPSGYGSRFVVYASYLGTATYSRWGPQPHWDPSGYDSGGFLFGSRPLTNYLHMNFRTAYYKFTLEDLTDYGTPARAVLPAGDYVAQDLRDPSGYAQGAQLTNGFEG